MTQVTYDPCAESPLLLWGTSWNEALQEFDWQISGTSLKDDDQLFNAVMLCLFTDKRARDDATLPGDDDDPRGWWGNYVDVDSAAGEQELGSHLWLFERVAMTDENLKGIEDAVRDALLPLVNSGMVASTSVSVEWDKPSGRVSIGVQAYSQEGEKMFDQRYARVWQQLFPNL